MNRRNIKKRLKQKYDYFLESIQDEDVKEKVKDNIIISGGAIVSLLLDEEVNDYDMYFRTKEAAVSVSEYLLNKYADKDSIGGKIDVIETDDGVRIRIIPEDDENIFDDFEYNENRVFDTKFKNSKNNFTPEFVTKNAITLSNDTQLILRFVGESDVLHSNFDFVHCKCFWDSKENKLTLPKAALESILNKELVYENSKYPLCSLFRIRKYLDRGWTINAGQITKAALDLNDLDLNNYETLQDQLIGVDITYFTEMLSKLKKENDSSEIDKDYLYNLINEYF